MKQSNIYRYKVIKRHRIKLGDGTWAKDENGKFILRDEEVTIHTTDKNKIPKDAYDIETFNRNIYNDYWQETHGVARVKYADATHRELRKHYKKLYKGAYRDTKNILVEFYDKISGKNQNNLLVSEMYRYDRYYKLTKELQNICSSLGRRLLNTITPSMDNMYTYTSSQVLETIGIDPKLTDKIVSELYKQNGKQWSERVWCKDGLNSRRRIEKNMRKLQNTVERGLMQCIQRGAPKEQMVQMLEERFGVSYNEADRLVRTELAQIQNQATLDSYEAGGIKQYKYCATLDDRTSEICQKLNTKVFDVDKAEVGVNYPPCHPQCRSFTVPVINGYAPNTRTYDEEAKRKAEIRRRYEEEVLKYNPKSKIKRYTEG